MKKALNILLVTILVLVASSSKCYAQKVTLDYGMTFEEMVAAGDYSYVGVLAKDFLFSGSDTVQLEMLTFCQSDFTNEEDVKMKVDQKGYRLAKVEELLAFGAVYKVSPPGYVLMTFAAFDTYSGIQSVPVAIETLENGQREFLITEFYPPGLCFLMVRK